MLRAAAAPQDPMNLVFIGPVSTHDNGLLDGPLSHLLRSFAHTHGRRGALKLATSTKDFKTESESRPTYIKRENLKK